MKKIEDLVKTYETLDSYQDEGHQVSIVKVKANDTEMKHKTIFETKFARNKSFDFNYTRYYNEEIILLVGKITKKDEQINCRSIIESSVIETMQEDLPIEKDITIHSGVTQRISSTVPRLLFSKRLDAFSIFEGTETVDFECEIKGERCLGVRVSRNRDVELPGNERQEIMNKGPKKFPITVAELKKMEEDTGHLESRNEQVSETITYYFRLRDKLLFKVEDHMNMRKMLVESVTEYIPKSN